MTDIPRDVARRGEALTSAAELFTSAGARDVMASSEGTARVIAESEDFQKMVGIYESDSPGIAGIYTQVTGNDPSGEIRYQ